MRIGLGQIEPRIGDLEGNLRSTEDIIKGAKEAELDVLVLPELANSGYAFESKEEARSLSEIIPVGPFSRTVKQGSSDDMLIVAGICEQGKDGIYNSAAAFANGEHVITYRKVHLFNKEKLWFKPGTKEPPTFQFQKSCFGVMVCWDWAFPEMARILALKGAQAILHPSNLVLPYCFDAMRIRSLENRLFTATCNRTGSERNLEFSGMSQITSTKGEVLLSLGDTSPDLGFVDLDLKEANDKKLTPRNDVLEDRLPTIYQRLIRP